MSIQNTELGLKLEPMTPDLESHPITTRPVTYFIRFDLGGTVSISSENNESCRQVGAAQLGNNMLLSGH